MTPLFKRILGAKFDALPMLLQDVHDSRPSKKFRGRCEIQCGRRWAARVLARMAALPKPARDVPIDVSIHCEGDQETWTRVIGVRRMQTRLAEREGLLVESVGPVHLSFSLDVVDETIVWRMAGARAMGFRLPLSWFTNVSAREAVESGRYTFDVRAELAYVGLLIHYRGWLERDA